MFQRFGTLIRFVGAVLISLPLIGGARAAVIAGGSDYLRTQSGTFLDFGPPIGLVNFKGYSINGGTYDTIVQRTSDTTIGVSGGLKITGLSLVSVAPVNGSLIYITLDPAHLALDIGTFTPAGSATGGTYTSEFWVYYVACAAPASNGVGCAGGATPLASGSKHFTNLGASWVPTATGACHFQAPYPDLTADCHTGLPPTYVDFFSLRVSELSDATAQHLAATDCAAGGLNGLFNAGTITITAPCGLQSLAVGCNNCTYTVTPYDCATTTATVTGTKVDPGQVARISATATDCLGNSADVDPIFTTLKVTAGHWASQTFANVTMSERFIYVANGAPGLRRLAIRINGRSVSSHRLDDNQSAHVDVARYLIREKNSITFIGQGTTGAFANIVVSDTPPAVQSRSRRPARDVGVWGPLVEELKPNSLE